VIRLGTFPAPLVPHGEAEVVVEGDAALRVAADARTDLFVSPDGSAPVLNAPRVVAAVEGDYLLSTRVSAALAATFDAGVLVVWVDERNWAKLCIELSPQGEPTIVSVVTRGVSDDCNSFAVAGPSAWLRVARVADAYAFHASTEGASWQLVRHFALATPDDAAVGFLAQSPTGDGCSVTFAEIAFSRERLRDLRSGA
jgi:hypothetical protein